MSYASKQSFGGQRASIARAVIVAVSTANGPRFRSGQIVAISDEKDVPIIEHRQVLCAPPLVTDDLTFYDAKTEEDMANMFVGSWCWPPRV